ncbi:MAG TPA: tRNA (adenosine(37)-N6)-dimethylallyltransferase MiaA [Bryobacterales bacterium]|nr:tRNA (adenosine(37)-N6)-dimethylallyltransferase MiaA [Bryobacterales bacterium]
MSPLVAILGPTGSGKSELALAVAGRYDAEIVNFDSIQIYRRFNIGAAKLTEAERRGIPHHLIDILEPHEVFTAGEFARRAAAVLREIAGRGRLPVLAGGTGFYLRALVDGLFSGPARNEELRRRLAARSPERLHRLLARLDSAAAQKIHPHDVPKMIRALEVTLLARRPISELFAQSRQALEGFTLLKIGLLPDRTALYGRINKRTEAMFAAGLVEEARQILESGSPPSAKPFESHGYRQALEHLRSEINLSEAISSAQRNTRRYAKRQITWFRREKDVEWLPGFGDDPAIQQQALERVAEWLKM